MCACDYHLLGDGYKSAILSARKAVDCGSGDGRWGCGADANIGVRQAMQCVIDCVLSGQNAL